VSRSDQPARLGRYEIRDVLAEGATGVVYRAHDPWIDRPVAIKVFKIRQGLSAAERQASRDQVLAEARAAGRLDHPNIVRVLDCAEDEQGAPYIVMEYLAGPSLATVLRDFRVRQDNALRILDQLSSAIDAAHAQGVVHRDIKPGNVLFNEEGDTAKIADFGLARADDPRATQDMNRQATPAYMAPEQAAGGPASRRSDLFSFGVLGYELLAGRPPYSGNDPVALAYQVVHEPPPPISDLANLPEPVDAVMARILDKDPDRRYASAREFCADLRAALAPVSADGVPAEADREASPLLPTPEAAAPPRRVPGGFVLWGASIGLAIGVVGWVLWPAHPAPLDPVPPPAAETAAPASTPSPGEEPQPPQPAPAPVAAPAPVRLAEPPAKAEPRKAPAPAARAKSGRTSRASTPPAPAAAVPVPAPQPAAPEPEPPAPAAPLPSGHVAVKLRHWINAGTLRVFVDGKPVLREEFSKRRLDPVKVSQWPAFAVEPGARQITAHVMGAKGKTYGSAPLSVQVEPDRSAQLEIRLKDDRLELALE